MRLNWLLFLASTVMAQTDEEALFLRRIAEFWQEGEYQIAKGQMEEFIAEYPESSYSEALSAALGDLFLREKNYTNALSYYSRIQSPEYLDRIFLNRMQCLYELHWHATLADECEAYLEKGPNLHATYFLAIALYHQCLNAAKDTEQLQKLAERAKPYFETLSHSELSQEVAQGYAHLCCILKDYSKATEIYLDLAKKDPSLEEEMLFQVALIQSEYDKEKALQTFEQIAKLDQKRALEANYNRLILAFDLGRHELLTDPEILSKIPPEKIANAHLLIGRSLIQLKQYDSAVSELKKFIQESPPSTTALLSLLDAAYQSNDLASFDLAIENLRSADPKELPKALFSRAQLLKKNQNISAAKEQFEQLLTDFPDLALFELAHLDYKAENWDSCYQKATTFLSQFPEHELSSFAWRYLISASVATQHPKLQEHLEAFLNLPIPESEKAEWKILLAKTYYEQKEYDKAASLLQHLDTPNAHLLLSLCTHDTQLTEKALSEGADLIDKGQIHASLYNTYLELSQFDQAADHLYAAFQAKAEIQSENLLWLADRYLEQETNFALTHRATLILEQCKATLHKLAKAYLILGRVDDEIALLEGKELTPDEQLLLAEGYARKGITDKARELFDTIVATSTTAQNPIVASASLQGARLKLLSENPNLVEIATQLKNLVVQKKFEGEPLYLEAALDYVDLQAKKDLSKKIALLEKTKSDFESRSDILSKDYHEARSKWPQKDKMYQGYMQLIDAEILSAKADLQNQAEFRAESKNLLHKIIDEQSATALLERARMLLTNIDAK